MSSLSMLEIRKQVTKMYLGFNWAIKVHKMTDAQVVAIYHKNEEKKNANNKRETL